MKTRGSIIAVKKAKSEQNNAEFYILRSNQLN